MLINFSITSNVYATCEEFMVGTYLTLGRYYGDPITWRCVAEDENGKLMLSDQILSIKCFDVGGEASGGSHVSENNQASYYFRVMFGSNYWADSNIRCWLNSTAPEQGVEWICQNPPIDQYYTRGYSYQKGYDDEKGFLSDDNFSKDERSLIKLVTLKNLLDPLDAYKAIDGTPYAWENWNVYSWKEKTPSENGYDDICFEYVSDKVFLLDVAQFYEAMQNESILGENYIYGLIDATQSAIENDIKPDSIFADMSTFTYWLRTPYGGRYQYVHDNWDYGDRVFTSGSAKYAEEMLVGVRPAFYLNEDNAVIVSGEGSKSSPYVLSCISETENSNNASENNDPFDISVFYNGSEIFFDQSPFIDDDLVLVPMRAIFEVFGANVEWNETELLITAVKGNDIIQMRIGDHKITKNDIVINSDVAPRIVGDRTFVPLRVIAECLNADVEWIEDEQKVIISKASE